ncbi:hypothetical protein [Streptomyces sp. CAU 1734]
MSGSRLGRLPGPQSRTVEPGDETRPAVLVLGNQSADHVIKRQHR